MRLSLSMIRRQLVLLILVGAVAACHEGQTPPRSPGLSPADGMAGLAVEDLARRLEISTDRIEVLSEQAVTWRDGALGCPREGMMYTQALVEGSRIVLRADGRNYAYHSGREGPPFYCAEPVKPAPASAVE